MLRNGEVMGSNPVAPTAMLAHRPKNATVKAPRKPAVCPLKNRAILLLRCNMADRISRGSPIWYFGKAPGLLGRSIAGRFYFKSTQSIVHQFLNISRYPRRRLTPQLRQHPPQRMHHQQIHQHMNHRPNRRTFITRTVRTPRSSSPP